MIIIADGDVIKNEVIRNKPQELGFEFLDWKRQTYGNKEFLLKMPLTIYSMMTDL